jgi:hypothetical protein
MKFRKLVGFSVLVFGALATGGCFRSGSNGLNSWISPDRPGDYIVVYDVLGKDRGKVTSIANGVVNFSERDQDVFKVSGRNQTAVFTSENQGEGGSVDTSIKISPGGVEGRANLTIVYNLAPTKDSMGRFIEVYQTTLEDFSSNQLRAAVQICATQETANLIPQNTQAKLPPLLQKCLTDSFKKLGVNINIVSVNLNSKPFFGEAYEAAIKRALTTQAEVEALELEKAKRTKEIEIERLVSDEIFQRQLLKRNQDLQEKAINKGINPFPVVNGSGSVTLPAPK